MKKIIYDILAKHVELYGHVSSNKYIVERKKIHKNDIFSKNDIDTKYKTILTLAIPYPSKEVKWKGKGYGVLSRYSYGVDYHIVFREILKNIEIELNQHDISTKSSVDISNIDERFACFLSGMGYLGKNQFLINKTYGSYIYLATILIDQEIPDEVHEYDDCKDCNLCVTSCPSNALEKGFDQSLCISNISQEKRELNLNEIKYFKTMIYGCDICQKVCPKNHLVDVHNYKDFEPSGVENVPLGEILKMSNREYKRRYGTNASSWKGATIIKRNALCLIANQNLVEFKDEIIKSMNDFKDVLWYNKTAEKIIKLLDRE